jgi:hypothetical protein
MAPIDSIETARMGPKARRRKQILSPALLFEIFEKRGRGFGTELATPGLKPRGYSRCVPLGLLYPRDGVPELRDADSKVFASERVTGAKNGRISGGRCPGG